MVDVTLITPKQYKKLTFSETVDGGMGYPWPNGHPDPRGEQGPKGIQEDDPRLLSKGGSKWTS